MKTIEFLSICFWQQYFFAWKDIGKTITQTRHSSTSFWKLSVINAWTKSLWNFKRGCPPQREYTGQEGRVQYRADYSTAWIFLHEIKIRSDLLLRHLSGFRWIKNRLVQKYTSIIQASLQLACRWTGLESVVGHFVTRSCRSCVSDYFVTILE